VTALASATAVTTIGSRLRWLIFFVVGLAVLVARRPETLLTPVFWNEDGPVFYQGALDGAPWWTPYRGYEHLAPRVVASLETITGNPALVGSMIALLVTVAVAAFVASDRMADFAPQSTRYVAAIVVLLLPASNELLGSPTYIQWYLALYLLLGLVARPAAGWWAVVDAVVVAIAALTGPFAIFVAPFYWLDRARRRTAVIVSAGAAIQVLTLLLSPRNAPPRIPDQLPEILARRLLIEPISGASLMPGLPILVAVVLVPFVLIALREWPLRVTVCAALILVGSLCLSIETSQELLDPYGAQRYFFLAGALIAIAVILAATHRSIAGLLLPLLAIGIIADFRLPPHPGV
jgi:hypothetical protein